jgi:hypothetical protein
MRVQRYGSAKEEQQYRQTAMLKHPKFRQAGLIVFATTLLLIIPNVSRVFG